VLILSHSYAVHARRSFLKNRAEFPPPYCVIAQAATACVVVVTAEVNSASSIATLLKVTVVPA